MPAQSQELASLSRDKRKSSLQRKRNRRSPSPRTFPYPWRGPEPPRLNSNGPSPRRAKPKKVQQLNREDRGRAASKPLPRQVTADQAARHSQQVLKRIGHGQTQHRGRQCGCLELPRKDRLEASPGLALSARSEAAGDTRRCRGRLRCRQQWRCQQRPDFAKLRLAVA